MKLTHRSIIRTILATVVVAGFFAAFWLLVKGNAEDTQIVLLLVGALIANFGAIVQFYFGSSAGSEYKTEVMASQEDKL
jgi:hypothetical protein